MMAVKVIYSSLGRGHIVTVFGCRKGGEARCCKFVNHIHVCSFWQYLIISVAFIIMQ